MRSLSLAVATKAYHAPLRNQNGQAPLAFLEAPENTDDCHGPSRLLERNAETLAGELSRRALPGLDCGGEDPLPPDQQGDRPPAEAADGRRRDRRGGRS